MTAAANAKGRTHRHRGGDSQGNVRYRIGSSQRTLAQRHLRVRRGSQIRDGIKKQHQQGGLP